MQTEEYIALRRRFIVWCLPRHVIREIRIGWVILYPQPLVGISDPPLLSDDFKSYSSIINSTSPIYSVLLIIIKHHQISIVYPTTPPFPICGVISSTAPPRPRMNAHGPGNLAESQLLTEEVELLLLHKGFKSTMIRLSVSQ